jgi:hypothetical protein
MRAARRPGDRTGQAMPPRRRNLSRDTVNRPGKIKVANRVKPVGGFLHQLSRSRGLQIRDEKQIR